MLNGADGAVKIVFVSLNVRFALFKHPEVYATLALSPAVAAALLANFILTIRDVKVPESKIAVDPRFPTNDHK